MVQQHLEGAIQQELDNQGRKRRRRRRLVVVAAVISATIALQYIEPQLFPQPLHHDSALTGQAWVLELLQGNPARIKTELGLYQHTFIRLVGDLRKAGIDNTKHVSAEEQVAVFLLICVGNTANRRTAGRFQRSGDTISRCDYYIILS
jgi:hypothetical protein